MSKCEKCRNEQKTSDKSETPYGWCPICLEPGKSRERRPNGNDICVNGHSYPSSSAVSSGEDATDKRHAIHQVRAAIDAAIATLGHDHTFRILDDVVGDLL